jgi:hypothetical protein
MPKSKKKEGFESFIEFLLDSGAAKAERIMMTMDDEQFMKYYAMMMEYAAPKRQRIDQETNQNTTHTVVVNWDAETISYRPSTPPLQSSASAEGVEEV